MTERKSEFSESYRYLLRDKLQHLGLVAFFTDFDDTLIGSHIYFTGKMKKWSGKLAQLCYGRSLVTKDEVGGVFSTMEEVLAALRPEFHVNPSVVYMTARATSQIYGVNFDLPDVQMATDDLMSLYNGMGVRYFEGVPETLNLLKDAGALNYMVTNASRENTDNKLWNSGLSYRFRFDGIYCIPDFRRKDRDAYLEVIESVGLEPAQIVVVDDNWSCLSSAIQAGIPPENTVKIITRYGLANQNPIAGISQIAAYTELPQHILNLHAGEEFG